MSATSEQKESRRAGLAVPLVLVSAILLMILPVPAAMLDALLALNISVAVLVLLGVVLLTDSLEFSVFPSLLLVSTLMRLALNVSSTRLILLEGYAGKVIETFGQFVVGGSVIVGLVVFLILIMIQFVVITNGAGRVAEVGARFTLDAMPGKQMAIDADLSAGLIDEEQARERRSRISDEAEFYGAMDGASKFVKGDAIAGIVVVMINLVGGFAIGVGSNGMSLSEAINTYSLLTIGDGLVSQIPALLISLSTGLLVTRVGNSEDLGHNLTSQLLGKPKAMRIAGGVICGIGLLPGLPKLVFFGMGISLAVMGTRKMQAEEEEALAMPDTERDLEVSTDPDDPEALINQMRIEPLELDLAYDILDLIDGARGGDLLDRVRALRRQIAMDVGVVMPYVRTRDDVSLGRSTYRIKVNGVEVASGQAPQDRILALPVGDGHALAALGGIETVEPVFGLPAWWVPTSARAEVAATGATVVDRSSVVITHLAEVVRSHAGELLSRQQVQMLVEGMRYDDPLLANDVSNEVVPIATLHAVLQVLLGDRVPIRNLPRIVEAIGTAGAARPTEEIANAARVALGGAIAGRITPQGHLAVVTLDPTLEAHCHESLRDIEGATQLVIDPTRVDQLLRGLERVMVDVNQQPHPVAIVCGQRLRRPLHRLISASANNAVPVLGYNELPSHLELHPVGVIGLAHITA